jgi:outer membrane lipase/esterase
MADRILHRRPLAWISGVLIAVIAAALAPQPTAAQTIGGLEFFGDSNSDDGNAWRISGKVFPASPPYWQGRFGDGPVWSELLRDRLRIPAGRYANHAVGGAYTGHGNRVSDIAPGTRLGEAMQNTGMLAQVDAYRASGKKPAADTLFVIWAGDNDYDAVDRVDPQAVTRAVANIEETVRQLAAAGAAQFMVVNINEDLVFPDGRAANAQAWNKANAADHNARLTKVIEALRKQLNVPIILFDSSAVTRAVSADPARFGFAEAVRPCYSGSIVESGKPCRNPDRHVFWDGSHLSHAAQKLIADGAARAIGNVRFGAKN